MLRVRKYPSSDGLNIKFEIMNLRLISERIREWEDGNIVGAWRRMHRISRVRKRVVSEAELECGWRFHYESEETKLILNIVPYTCLGYFRLGFVVIRYFIDIFANNFNCFLFFILYCIAFASTSTKLTYMFTFGLCLMYVFCPFFHFLFYSIHEDRMVQHSMILHVHCTQMWILCKFWTHVVHIWNLEYSVPIYAFFGKSKL